MKTRKSIPELTIQQRRRQIIDLLAAHLARMPEASRACKFFPQGRPCTRNEEYGIVTLGRMFRVQRVARPTRLGVGPCIGYHAPDHIPGRA
jgi:hypothetical protein